MGRPGSFVQSRAAWLRSSLFPQRSVGQTICVAGWGLAPAGSCSTLGVHSLPPRVPFSSLASRLCIAAGPFTPLPWAGLG